MFRVCLSVVFGCLGASGHDSSVWVIKHTHAVISTTPSQNRLEALEGCWTEAQLQLACSVTVYTVTPFKICQLQCWACQSPSDHCLVLSTFPYSISLQIYSPMRRPYDAYCCYSCHYLNNCVATVQVISNPTSQHHLHSHIQMVCEQRIYQNKMLLFQQTMDNFKFQCVIRIKSTFLQNMSHHCSLCGNRNSWASIWLSGFCA